MTVNVLITGIGGGGNGMEILKALRLSGTAYKIVGTDLSKLSYGSSFVDKFYVVPPAGHQEYIDSLIRIIKENKIRALFSGSEPELKAISKNRNLFKDYEVMLPLNSEAVIELCMNKLELMDYLKSKGAKVPETFLISSLSDIENIDTDKYPLVCKPHVGSGGSNNVFIVQNKRELNLIAQYLMGYLGGFITQEYVGGSESEYTVGVLSDFDGNLIDSIAVKRHIISGIGSRVQVPNRTDNRSLGEVLVISSGISQGRIGRYPEITEYCEKVSSALMSKGPLNLQCRLYDGEVYIFEINPRLSGTTYFRAMVGFNEPDILIRKYVLSEKISGKRMSYKEGFILRGLHENFIDIERV